MPSPGQENTHNNLWDTTMADMNGPLQPGSQPASGGMNSGSVTGGFEVLPPGMGIGGGAGLSPPGSTVGGMSMTDVTLEQALARMQELARENAELRGGLCLSS